MRISLAAVRAAILTIDSRPTIGGSQASRRVDIDCPGIGGRSACPCGANRRHARGMNMRLRYITLKRRRKQAEQHEYVLPSRSEDLFGYSRHAERSAEKTILLSAIGGNIRWLLYSIHGGVST